MPIAHRGNQRGTEMWPSEAWASRLYDIANWGLVAGLVVGIVSTILVVWMGNVKESYLRRDLANTNERAAKAERDTAQLEAAVAGRRLTAKQIADIAESLRRFAGRELFITSYSGDAEAVRLGLQIKDAIEQSGIHISDQLGRTIATGGGVSFGVSISGWENDHDLMDAVSAALRDQAAIQTDVHIVVPTMRINQAVTGIMVALKPITNDRP
jgi:hypothetical protein